MYRVFLTSLLLASFLILALRGPAVAQTPEYGTGTLEAGRMTLTVSRAGQIAPTIQGVQKGLLWPAGPEGTQEENIRMRSMLFSATPVLAGRVRGQLRVSASYYRDNYLPGPILPGLRTVNPYDSRYRPFVIRIGGEADRDFVEWPYELGAPVDSAFAPEFYGSPQMFWVMNDLDSAAMRENIGNDPMGLELRCLAFPATDRSFIGTDAMLLQYTWINHSPDTIHDAYAGFFADPDLRDGGDEYAGSDSLAALAYVYDDDYVDPKEEGMPTAFGISMLQTPVVRGLPTDSARWSAGMLHGFRNIPVTAAIVPWKSPITNPAAEPEIGAGADGWYALLQGEGRGTAIRNPLTGMPSRFWYSGNPLSGEGWQMEDGLLFDNGETAADGRPHDQRIMVSAGPFTLLPGDTQQVVIAMIASRAATGRAAAYQLRDRADFLRQYYQRHNAIDSITAASVIPEALPAGGVRLRFILRGDDVLGSVQGEIVSSDGTLLQRLPLTESISQESANYSGSVDIPEGTDGVNTAFIVTIDGETHRLPGRVSIPLAGAVDGGGAALLQEYDGNGRIAPDEDAHWIPRLYNSTQLPLDLRLEASHLPYTEWMNFPALPARTTSPSASYPWQTEYGYRTVPVDTDNWGTVFDSVRFEYDLYDVEKNSWWRLSNWVQVDSTAEEWYDLLMTPVITASEQRPGLILENLEALRDRSYLARISEGRMLSLYDSASGTLLFEDFGLDEFNGMAPIVDGFRVVRGTIGSSRQGYFFTDVEGLQTSEYGMWPAPAGTSVFANDERREFRIDFTLDGREYWLFADRGYEGRVRLPLRAYMKEDDGSWTAVQVALVEMGPDIPDGDPNPDGGDYLMLYQLPYQAEGRPDVGILPESIAAFPAPLLLYLNALPTSGSLSIEYPIPVMPGDVFVFNPRHVLLAESNKSPEAATLHAPTPMPFTQWTSVVVELQQAGQLRAEVYNTLGQRVDVLFDGMQEKGKHLMVWDGYWNDGRMAESGMYLLRVETGGREISRKLLLLR
ncbi:T9SS type A sorting domain-containing protein [bacterium]|nr:T9SS type A sorting domain-containing protein [bacterium]